jgi:predicted metal-dependent enzyme (double-stranded beta helix superfamily)
MTPALQKLIAGTAAATARDAGPRPDALLAAIHGSLFDLDLLAAEHRRAGTDSYSRHLLHADPQGLFSILAIVWGPGQGSPVHAHHTWCAVGVYAGEITESHYHAPPGAPYPVKTGTVRRGPGDSCFDSGRSGIHRIANESDELAISIHVYGVGADRIVTGVNRVYPMPGVNLAV